MVGIQLAVVVIPVLVVGVQVLLIVIAVLVLVTKTGGPRALCSQFSCLPLALATTMSKSVLSVHCAPQFTSNMQTAPAVSIQPDGLVEVGQLVVMGLPVVPLT